nr:hypothetical protein [Tanacetum cinerariifolium]
MHRQSILVIDILSLQAMVKVGLICLVAVPATELSPISYLLVGVVKRALFQRGMSASGILSLPEVDGIDEGNRNDEVGSGVNIDILAATRYPNGGGVAAVSHSSKGSVSSEAETELYIVGAGTVRASISSAGDRYSGYSGPEKTRMSSMNTMTNLSKNSWKTRFIKSMNIAGAL